jgi:hypothetical protein
MFIVLGDGTSALEAFAAGTVSNVARNAAESDTILNIFDVIANLLVIGCAKRIRERCEGTLLAEWVSTSNPRTCLATLNLHNRC